MLKISYGRDLHLASLRRQISMNCLISDTSRGMLKESVGRRELVLLSLARRCRSLDIGGWNFGGRVKREGIAYLNPWHDNRPA